MEKHSEHKLRSLIRENIISLDKDFKNIMLERELIQLGYFNTQEEAYEAKKKFEVDNGIINKYS
jgi:hypothetical protein